MAAGGTTRETAGALDLGSGNTFTVADATEDGYFGFDSQAWWTFSIASPAVVTLTSTPGSILAVFRGDYFAFASSEGGSEAGGSTATYVLTPGTYDLIVGLWPDASPTTYQITYAHRAAASSPWLSDLRDNDENYVTIADGISGDDAPEWHHDAVRKGSSRHGDYSIRMIPFSGIWGPGAAACAAAHALNGDQSDGVYPWDDNCPIIVDGGADFQDPGASGVFWRFDPEPGGLINPTARMRVNTTAYGIWLKPVEENLPPRGVLNFPSPEDYGYPEGAEIEWESDTVDLWKVEIADRAGDTFAGDPESWYAVNHTRQPSFGGGEWNAWQRGMLPGPAYTDSPLTTPDWVDGQPGSYSLVFPSEGVDFEDKTWHELAVPADGFDGLTQDYVNDSYDYGIGAGPAEVFGEREFDADRSAPTAIWVKVYVRSPRFRWIYDGPTTIPPRRIVGRPGDGLTGPARVFGGGSTVQTGRIYGGIL